MTSLLSTAALPRRGRRDPAPWTDGKRSLWLFGLFAPSALFIAIPIIWALNKVGWTLAAQVPFWIGPILIYLVVPLADRRYGRDSRNPPAEVLEYLENDPYYRYCTYLFFPLQYATVFCGAVAFTAPDLGWLGYPDGLGWFAKLGVALSVGVLGGTGINVAHELGHKKDSVERWLSRVTLAQTCYGHFYIEHNRGHHARVATPEDPASARFGESYWMFLPRSVSGGVASALRLEAARIRRRGNSPWNPRTYLANDVLSAWLMSVAVFAGLLAVFGPALIPYLVIQAVYGVSLLEAINYLEHYGLLRARNGDGRYERCRPEHSWNSDHMVTNVFLFHLQRHSDHHANPTRRYQTLRSVREAPELPAGYARMIGLAYFPPLWRRTMDHRVLGHYDGDITRVNIDPRRREQILARYPVSR